MRRRRILPIAALLSIALATGCTWLDKIRDTKNPAGNTGPLKPKKPEEFVSYLNRQSTAVQTLRYDDVGLRATVPGAPWIPALRSGVMVAQKPKNFRMQSGFALGGDQLDIGSNSQEFWMYVKQPKPTYLYCSHLDFPKVQDDLPVPFEPDWALQALGLATYDTTKPYEVEISEKNRAYYLKWPDVSPNGTKVLKVIEFAGDASEGTTPQVRRHRIMSQTKTGWQTDLFAEITKVAVLDAGLDPQTQQRMYVQVPTEVLLEWPVQKVKLNMTLGKPQLNTKEAPALFTKPAKIDNASPVNLVDLRNGTASSFARGATPNDLPDRRRK